MSQSNSSRGDGIMKTASTLFGVLLVALLPAAELLQEWNYNGAVLSGIQGNPACLELKAAPKGKTPDGASVLMVKLISRPSHAFLHSVQLNYVSKQKIMPGARYLIHFYLKADREGMVGVNATVVADGWPMLSGSMRKIKVGGQWQKILVEFTASKEYAATIRTPMFMLGEFPVGGTLYIGPVRLEKLADFPLTLDNRAWKVVLRPTRPSVTEIPADARNITPAEGIFDLSRLEERFSPKEEAFLYREFDAPADGLVEIGCAADYWFEFFINGIKVYDTLQKGNATSRYVPEDHIFSFPVKQGRNLIAVRVLSGSNGWKFVYGTPRRNKLSRVVEIRRGALWRPVNIGHHEWKYLTPQAIPELKIIPGSALDLSRQFRRHDIDQAGWLRLNAKGELIAENDPQNPIRLRGFNFLIHAWNRNFYKMDHVEIETLAEEIRLRGMNVVRFHYLNASLCGHAGFPKKSKKIEAVTFAGSAEELPVDPQFLDRYDFFIKCLRDRGIYVLLDIVTTSGGWIDISPSAAIPSEQAFRYRLFFDDKYRRNYLAGFDFLMNHINPYTGKALKDDPQLAGITLYNEQDALFLNKFYLFNDQWRQAAPSNAPDFNVELLRSDSPYGKAARDFLLAEIQQMNEFYLNAVKKTGYKGMVTLWDMFTANLENQARAGFPAVAVHSYFAHPAKRNLGNLNYTQKLRYCNWWQGLMFNVYQGSSISSSDSYLGRAAAARSFGKPFLLTEYSHSPYNRFVHESGPMIGAYAALQKWNVLISHGNSVALYYEPLHSYSFDGALSPMAMVSSYLIAFAWQRFDVKSAKHAVNFHITSQQLASPVLLEAIGGSYNVLYMLTGIGSSYGRKAGEASLNVTPMQFAFPSSSGVYVETEANVNRRERVLRELIEMLRKKQVLLPSNATDLSRGIFQSETGEITADVLKQEMTIMTPRLQAAVLKNDKSVELGEFHIISAAAPCTLAAISLERKPLKSSRRILLVYGTMAVAEDAVFLTEDFGMELDIGRLQPLLKTGTFEVSLDNPSTGPRLYALNLNGSREKELPVAYRNGKLLINVDTSRLEYGTPFFELSFDGRPRPEN